MIRGNAVQLYIPISTDFNASALYDSYNASNIPRPFVQENMTHTALTPMGLNLQVGNNMS